MDAQINFKKGEIITADQAMQMAMDVALKGAPYVSPNPVVGCVVVNADHQFLAFGYHPKFGQEHAEINALNKLSDHEIKDSTFYVTLEPCAHQGKTGSCAIKLSSLPIKKVVYGLVDPNPLVRGQGAAILQKAGIATEEYSGLLKNDLLNLSEIFLKNFGQKKVFIAAKIASSLDGQIALKSGESKWITSASSRKYVHELRSYYDAILVGANTITQDDPSLNIRHDEIQKENKVIVLDLENTIFKSDYKFVKLHNKENIIFAVNKKNPLNLFHQIEFSDLENLTTQIYELGIRSIFIEGGARTYSSFLQAGLIDRLYIFMAPSIIGAQSGLSWTSHVQTESLDKKMNFADLKVTSLGSDILLTAKFTSQKSDINFS